MNARTTARAALQRATCTALALVLAACGTTPPSRFFVLAPLAGPAAGAAGAAAGGLVVVQTVHVPDLVDRPQIVTSLSAHERRFDEYARWAEPLAPHLTGVLAENLAALLAPRPVLVEPSRDGRDAACRVSVEVLHFEAWSGGDAVLTAHWCLFGPSADPTPLAEGTGSWRTPAGTGDPEQLAAAMSRNLLELSRALAEAIARHPTT